jgi:hypothetical protein
MIEPMPMPDLTVVGFILMWAVAFLFIAREDDTPSAGRAAAAKDALERADPMSDTSGGTASMAPPRSRDLITATTVAGTMAGLSLPMTRAAP